MTISNKEREHWIAVADGLVSEFLAAREQAALDRHQGAKAASAPKARTTAPHAKTPRAPAAVD